MHDRPAASGEHGNGQRKRAEAPVAPGSGGRVHEGEGFEFHPESLIVLERVGRWRLCSVLTGKMELPAHDETIEKDKPASDGNATGGDFRALECRKTRTKRKPGCTIDSAAVIAQA
jgi:hypothetical protein